MCHICVQNIQATSIFLRILTFRVKSVVEFSFIRVCSMNYLYCCAVSNDYALFGLKKLILSLHGKNWGNYNPKTKIGFFNLTGETFSPFYLVEVSFHHGVINRNFCLMVKAYLLRPNLATIKCWIISKNYFIEFLEHFFFKIILDMTLSKNLSWNIKKLMTHGLKQNSRPNSPKKVEKLKLSLEIKKIQKFRL